MNHNRLTLTILAASTLLLGHLTARAQGSGGDALLHDYTELYQFVGAGFGWSWWQNEASFGVTDNSLPCVFFTDGEGNGPIMEVRGLFYPFRNPWVIVSPRLRLEDRAGTYISALPDEPIRGENNQEITLTQEAQVDATMRALNLELLVGLELFQTGLYVAAGGSGGLMLDGYYNYTERLLTPVGFAFTSTGTNEQQLLDARAFENYETITADLRGGLGYVLRLGEWGINAEALYSYPLTSALRSPELLKQQGIMGSISILYNIGASDE